METCLNYTNYNEAFFSSDEPKWIRYIRRLKEEHPNEITILAEPETNDGCIYCKFPPSIMKLKFPKNISEAHKQKMIETLAKARASHTSP